jgi:PhzF family phenazine biosynthesis protein
VELRYRLLNVFTVPGRRLSGNALCVFEDGAGLDAATMQALARQLNLSETTFVLPATRPDATARVRIFTPDFEMPFAGHPTLGTAEVVRALAGGAGDSVALEMAAGLVEVTAEGARWTLKAARAPEVRPPSASPDELAAMLGLAPGAVERPLWVDTGALQLVVPVRSAAEVEAARPDPVLLDRLARAPGGEAMAYLWAEERPGEVSARFFFMAAGGVVEDPATGSACANLGGWLLATGAPRPVRWALRQGAQAGRPSRLGLEVTAAGAILVSGEVVVLGRGTLRP